jgi:hypothetical protein
MKKEEEIGLVPIVGLRKTFSVENVCVAIPVLGEANAVLSYHVAATHTLLPSHIKSKSNILFIHK